MDQKEIDRFCEIHDIEFAMDGDMLMCIRPGFTNLVQDPAGFGETEEEAYQDLIENEAK